VAGGRTSIWADDRARLGWTLALLCFCATGLPRTFTAAAAQSVFLDRVGAELIPLTYVAMALVTPLLGMAYAALERRLPLLWVSAGLVLLDMAVLAGLRLGLATPWGDGFGLALGLWYQVEWALTSLVTWVLATRLLTLREGRVWFGRITIGGLLAQGLGGLAVGPLLQGIGPADLLWFSVLGGAGGLASLALLARLVPPGAASDADAEPEDEALAPPGAARARRLFPILFGGSIFAYFLVEYLFLRVLETNVPDPADTAALLGGLSAAEGFLSIAVSAAAPWLFRRAGLPVALGLLPVALLAGGAATGLLILAGGPLHPLALWLALGTLLVDAVLRYTLDRQAGLALLQPLPGRERTSLQLRIESLAEPVACGAAGLALLGLGMAGADARLLGGIGLAVAALALWRLWIGGRAQRLFRDLLAEAIRRRDLPAADLALDEASLEIVAEGLRSDQPSRVLYALTLLQERAPGRIAPRLPDLIAHPQPLVRSAALSACAAQPHEVLSALGLQGLALERLREEHDPALAVAMAGLLRSLGQAGALDGLVPALFRAHTVAVAAALLAHGTGEARETALALTRELTGSLAAIDRVAAARILRAAATPDLEPFVAALLVDGDAEVRREALGAAAALGGADLARLVVGEIARGRTGREALDELAAFGAAALPPIRAALDAALPGTACRVLLEGLARLGTAEALELVAGRLESGTLAERRFAAAALVRAGRRHPRPERLWRGLERELAVHGGLSRLAAGAERAGPPALATALAEEVAAQAELALDLLGAGTDPSRLAKARRALLSGSAEERAIALEMIEGSAPRHLRAALMALVEPSGAPPVPVDDLAAALRALGPDDAGPWLLEMAAHAAGVDDGDATGEGRAEVLTVEKVLLLRSTEIFAGVPQAQLAGLAGHAKALAFQAGETVFAEGDFGDALYVIADGRVAVERGGRTLAELGPGEMVGEMAALDPEPRSATIRCLEPARLLRIGHGVMGQFIDDYPDVARSVVRLLIRRLRRANAMLVAR